MTKKEAESLHRLIEKSLDGETARTASYGRGLWTVQVEADGIQREYRDREEWERGEPVRTKAIEDIPTLERYPTSKRDRLRLPHKATGGISGPKRASGGLTVRKPSTGRRRRR